jgi:hypothetical protein
VRIYLIHFDRMYPKNDSGQLMFKLVLVFEKKIFMVGFFRQYTYIVGKYIIYLYKLWIKVENASFSVLF